MLSFIKFDFVLWVTNSMEISEQIKSLLPPQYDADAQNIEYFRVLKRIKLPDSSRTPTEYNWLTLGTVTESYFVAIDTQIHIPEQSTIALNIKLEENNRSFGRIAYWNGKIWGYSPIGGLGPEDHPIEHNRWNLRIFQGVLSSRDFKCLEQLDRSCHWVMLVRS